MEEGREGSACLLTARVVVLLWSCKQTGEKVVEEKKVSSRVVKLWGEEG